MTETMPNVFVGVDDRNEFFSPDHPQAMNVRAGAGTDIIVLGPYRGSLVGGEAGDDFLFGDDQGQTSAGGSGSILVGDYLDQETASDGADQIIGTPGDDAVYGGGGDDFVDGRSGNDTIYGGSGNEELLGGDGADTIHGGDGADILIASGVSAYPTLENIFVQYNGDDDAHYADPPPPWNADQFYVASNPNDRSTDTLYGDGGTDTLVGAAGDDFLYGGADNDTLHGGDGNDIVYGDGGSNVVYGDAGNDQLHGGESFNDVYGGKGNDTLYADGSDGLYGGDGFDVASYADFNFKVVVTLHGDALVHAVVAGIKADGLTGIEGVEGGQKADKLTGDDRTNSFEGLGGDDILKGGGGQDYLTGGLGKDRFVYDGAGDSTGSNFDVISDFDAKSDGFNLPTSVTGIDDAFSAKIREQSVDHDVAKAVDAARLHAHHAVLVKVKDGILGATVLVVDANGVAGYQSGQDYLFYLRSPFRLNIDTGNFHQTNGAHGHASDDSVSGVLPAAAIDSAHAAAVEQALLTHPTLHGWDSAGVWHTALL